MEKILEIVEFEETSPGVNTNVTKNLGGFIITTTSKNVLIGITTGQSCCESFGYFCTNDDTSEFIGAELFEVKIVDECLNVEKAPAIYEGGAIFVNFETSNGTLQFTVYNEHNGYYGHSVIVKTEDKEIISTVL